MKFVLFYHSLVSDWNHGNAHFLRGVASELIHRGHEVRIYEPRAGWSCSNLLRDEGERALHDFTVAYPELHSIAYEEASLDVHRAVDGADVVIVHEWNTPQLIASVGRHAAQGGCVALFHDTHHRSVTAPDAMAALDLRHYHGVLAFGRAVAEQYLVHGWTARAWTWHEAADVRRFHPHGPSTCEGDLIWIGNWGDDERSDELNEFLLEPVRLSSLRARIHGVRYPQHALDALSVAGIEYAGWIANHRVPAAFSRYRCTVHVPRRAYARSLPGIPTIRMFEALACGIPLVSAPWCDDEGLFRPGTDYLVAANGAQMREHLRALLADRDLATRLASSGLESIRKRHTCAHRVDELLHIVAGVRKHGSLPAGHHVMEEANP